MRVYIDSPIPNNDLHPEQILFYLEKKNAINSVLHFTIRFDKSLKPLKTLGKSLNFYFTVKQGYFTNQRKTSGKKHVRSLRQLSVIELLKKSIFLSRKKQLINNI